MMHNNASTPKFVGKYAESDGTGDVKFWIASMETGPDASERRARDLFGGREGEKGKGACSSAAE